jgi:hypothetical protein
MAWLSRRARIWQPLRLVAGLALLGIACWVISGKSSELSGAGAFLAQPRWEWLVLAAAAELLSFLSSATMQRRFLLAGRARGPQPRLSRVTLITFASNSIQAALPVGAAFAGFYQFRQYQLIGADEILAGWVVIASGALLFAALATLAGLSLALAASAGSTFDLAEATVGVMVLALLAVALWVRRGEVFRGATRVVTLAERLSRHPRGHWTGPLGKTLDRMRAVAPTRSQWAAAAAAAYLSWLTDCACLAFAFVAVGAGVPWQGLLLAYCGGQLAVSLPITPGGLGVVEGSLTVALVAFGGGRAATVAAVLLYRVISFWLPLPTGAGCYLVLARRRARSLREQAQVEQAQVEQAQVEQAQVEQAQVEQAQVEQAQVEQAQGTSLPTGPPLAQTSGPPDPGPPDPDQALRTDRSSADGHNG